MKEKPRSLAIILAVILAAILVGGMILLSAAEIPNPGKPMEKQLDAKAFLEQKQP